MNEKNDKDKYKYNGNENDNDYGYGYGYDEDNNNFQGGESFLKVLSLSPSFYLQFTEFRVSKLYRF